MNHQDNASMLWPMIILMIIFSYVLMSNVMLTFRNGIYNHVNKAYMALLMGSLMGVIHYIIVICQGHGNYNDIYGLILWIIISIIFILLIQQQIAVVEQEFLKGMIEHHDMALLMSQRIINKTNDAELKKFVAKIIETQQDEINWMKQKLINNSPNISIPEYRLRAP